MRVFVVYSKPKPEKKGNDISKSKKTTPASIVWFEIPADDVKRAKSFYTALFGWKIKAIPGMQNYWHIDTGGADDSPTAE